MNLNKVRKNMPPGVIVSVEFCGVVLLYRLDTVFGELAEVICDQKNRRALAEFEAVVDSYG